MAAKTNWHRCGTKLRHCQIKSNEILFAQNTSHLMQQVVKAVEV